MKLFQAKSIPSVIHISRAGMVFFLGGEAQPQMYPFPVDLFPDLEVTSGEDDLRQRLITWKQQAGFELGQCIVVLSSDVYFSQDSATSEPSQDPQIQQFLAAVPFEDIKVHTSGISSGFRVVALNNEWFSLITKAMEKLQWEILMVLPDFVIADVLKPEGFDAQTASELLNRSTTLSPYNLYLPPEPVESDQPLHISTSTKITSTTIGLIIFFAVLLIVLGVVAYVSMRNDQTVVPPISSTPSAETLFVEPQVAVPSPTATVSATESAIPVDLSTFSVRILNGSGVANQATTLKNALAEKGFVEISIGNSSSNAISKTVVVVKNTVPITAQQAVVDVLETLGFSPSSQSSTETLDADIVITTGQDQQVP